MVKQLINAEPWSTPDVAMRGPSKFALPRQVWSHSPITRRRARSIEAASSEGTATWLAQAMTQPDSKFLFHANGKIAFEISTIASAAVDRIAWRSWPAIAELGLHPSEAGTGDSLLYLLGDKDDSVSTADPVLGDPGWRFAVDASDVAEPLLLETLGVVLKNPRETMPTLSHCQLGVIGQAISRISWHREVASCRPTTPTGGGHHRRDHQGRSVFPRTDPVAHSLLCVLFVTV